MSTARAEDPTPALSLADAKLILSGLVVEKHRLTDLREVVQQLAEGVFVGGTGEIIAKFIEGELSSEVCRSQQARYTLPAFLAAVKVGTVDLRLSKPLSGLLRFDSSATSGYG